MGATYFFEIQFKNCSCILPLPQTNFLLIILIELRIDVLNCPGFSFNDFKWS
jgi:hypothetical protein